MSDAEVHRRYKEYGEKAAWAHLWDKYYKRLLRSLKNRWWAEPEMINDIEDIVEDALIEILRTKPPNDLQPAIIYKAVHREAIDHYRKLTRRGMTISDNREDCEDRRPQEDYLQSADPPIDEEVWERQLEAAVAHCKGRLTAKQKQVLELKAEDLTFEEIAQGFNISGEAARKICKRAEDSLRRCLKTKNIDL